MKPVLTNIEALPPLDEGLKPLNEELKPLQNDFDFCELWEKVETCLDNAVANLNQADALIKSDLNAVLFSDFETDKMLSNKILTAQRRIQVFAEYISLIGSDFDDYFRNKQF